MALPGNSEAPGSGGASGPPAPRYGSGRRHVHLRRSARTNLAGHVPRSRIGYDCGRPSSCRPRWYFDGDPRSRRKVFIPTPVHTRRPCRHLQDQQRMRSHSAAGSFMARWPTRLARAAMERTLRALRLGRISWAYGCGATAVSHQSPISSPLACRIRRTIETRCPRWAARSSRLRRYQRWRPMYGR